MLYLTGKYANLLRRATVTVNPAALAAYPLANLSDNDPSTPTVFGSLAANSYVQVLLNPLTNPNFESALATGWTDTSTPGGTATRVNTAGHVNSGTWGVDLVSAGVSAPGAIYQDVTASAGEYRQLGVYAKSISGTPAFVFQVRNLNTGKYWTGSAWSAATSNITPTGTLSGAFSFLYSTYQVEDFDTCRADEVTIRVTFINNSAAASTVAIDDAQDVPGVSFAGVFGHNLNGVTSVVQYDASGAFSGGETNLSSMTIARGSYYSTFAMTYTSPWRLVIGGTNWDEPYLGEVVLGQYQEATAAAQWGLSVESEFPGVRSIGPSGRTHAYNYSSDARRGLSMTFEAYTAAAARELSDALWLRSGQGRYPAIIVPSSTETDVLYGHLSEPLALSRPPGIYATGMRLHGAPMPTVGA